MGSQELADALLRMTALQQLTMGDLALPHKWEAERGSRTVVQAVAFLPQLAQLALRGMPLDSAGWGRHRFFSGGRLAAVALGVAVEGAGSSHAADQPGPAAVQHERCACARAG